MKIFFTLFVSILSFTLIAQDYNQVDSKGRKQGPWRKKYEESNQFMYVGQFKDDKPVGQFTYFYPDAKVKAKVFHKEGSSRSEAFFYHENGKKLSRGIYRDMKKDSIWSNFGPSGRLTSKETYVADQLHGQVVIYFISEDPDDYSQIVSEVFTYKYDKKEGEYLKYFINGTLMVKGQYKNNLQEGVWTEYHLNGKRFMFNRYKKGLKSGWQLIFDEKEIKIDEVYYHLGRPMVGEELEKYLAILKENGIDPND